MKSEVFLYGFAGLIIGLIIGFVAANAVGQSASNDFRLKNAEISQNQIKSAVETSPAINKSALSAQEIRRAVGQADSQPENIGLQKDLGFSLYQYAKTEQQIELLPDVQRLLERANKKNTAGDFDVLVVLGEVALILGQQENAADKLLPEARSYYEKALKIKPEAFELHTDLGAAYFFARPSEPERAIAEYRKTLAAKPRDERTLGYLIETLIVLKKTDEARLQIESVKNINPENSSIPDWQIRLSQLEIQK